ncbi:hypothetical protein AC249_AIPGENE18701 [Exaiptasia diaphana]|nr:hypothetical protein AC249_AIPGENE18701 [Exaiptasia diaphana]
MSQPADSTAGREATSSNRDKVSNSSSEQIYDCMIYQNIVEGWMKKKGIKTGIDELKHCLKDELSKGNPIKQGSSKFPELSSKKH